MSNEMNNIEKLTIEYVKIYQKIYMVRQDIFDSLNIFNGKGSIQCSSEQSDFKLIAQALKKQSNFLKKDMSLVRIFEETLKECKHLLLSFENLYSRQVNSAKTLAKVDSQLSDKRSVLLQYFEINTGDNNLNTDNNNQAAGARYSIEINLAS